MNKKNDNKIYEKYSEDFTSKQNEIEARILDIEKQIKK